MSYVFLMCIILVSLHTMGTKVIKELRKGKGENGRTLTKSMLAAVSGVGRNKISRMEKEVGSYSYRDVEAVLKVLGYKILFVLEDNQL